MISAHRRVLPILSAVAVSVGLVAGAPHGAALAGRQAGGGFAPAGSLYLVVPVQAFHPGTRSYAVQVRLRLAGGRTRPLYHPFRTVDGPLAVPSVAVSANGRWLAYSDARFRLHLVTLPGGADRVIGRGMMPAFSFDARFVAFLGGPLLPLADPGPAATQLLVYDLRRGTLAHVALPRGMLLRGVAWAPRSDRLAWQVGGARGPLTVGLAAAAQPAAVHTYALPANARTDGGIAWSADGQALLYWRFVSSAPLGPRYALMRWLPPLGPAQMVVPAAATAWSEGTPPAPVPNAQGTLIAALLGGPGGAPRRVVLDTPGQRTTQAIPLPGEPRLVSFSPTGMQLVAAWSAPQGSVDVRRAALADAITGRVQDLGPAVAAFWVR